MKNPLLRFVSAFGLALGAMRSSKSQQTPMSVTVGLDGLIENVTPRSGLWLSPFDRQEYRQGRRFRSQKERSNRRKSSR
jgi:hypothetical protein